MSRGAVGHRIDFSHVADDDPEFDFLARDLVPALRVEGTRGRGESDEGKSKQQKRRG